MQSAIKYLAAAAVLCVIATGCNMNKKSSSSSSVPPMNVAAIDVPAPTAPAATFTPQQPVTYDVPQASAAEEEPASEAFASTEDIAPPRATAQARPRSRASVSGTRYKVKKGESLWSIAQAKYGSGAKWKAIAAANPKMDPNKIQAGQTIILP